MIINLGPESHNMRSYVHVNEVVRRLDFTMTLYEVERKNQPGERVVGFEADLKSLGLTVRGSRKIAVVLLSLVRNNADCRIVEDTILKAIGELIILEPDRLRELARNLGSRNRADGRKDMADHIKQLLNTGEIPE